MTEFGERFVFVSTRLAKAQIIQKSSVRTRPEFLHEINENLSHPISNSRCNLYYLYTTQLQNSRTVYIPNLRVQIFSEGRSIVRLYEIREHHYALLNYLRSCGRENKICDSLSLPALIPSASFPVSPFRFPSHLCASENFRR